MSFNDPIFSFLIIIAPLIVSNLFYTNYSYGDFRFNSSIEIKYVLFIYTLFYLFILSAFKTFEIGTDTKTYIEIYDWMISSKVTGRYEPGFFYLTKLIHKLGGDFRDLLIISYCIMYYGLFRLIQLSNNKIFALILFFLVLFIPMNSALRQAISLGFICLAYVSYQKQQHWKKNAYVILAICFHYAAVVVCAVFILKRFKFTVGRAIVCLLFSLFVARLELVSSIFKISPIYAIYAEQDASGSIFYVSGLIGLIHLIISIYIFRRSPGNQNNLFFWMASLYICTMIISTDIPGMFRAAYFFYPGFLMLGPLEKQLRMFEKQKLMMVLLLVFIHICLNLMIISKRPMWGGFFPYDWILT